MVLQLWSSSLTIIFKVCLKQEFTLEKPLFIYLFIFWWFPTLAPIFWLLMNWCHFSSQWSLTFEVTANAWCIYYTFFFPNTLYLSTLILIFSAATQFLNVISCFWRSFCSSAQFGCMSSLSRLFPYYQQFFCTYCYI